MEREMSLWSEEYRRHPACIDYHAAMSAADAEWDREMDAIKGMTHWREAAAEIDARYAEAEQRAATQRDTRLALEGLVVEELFLGPKDGYILTLQPQQRREREMSDERQDTKRALVQHRASGEHYIVEYSPALDDDNNITGTRILAGAGPLHYSDLGLEGWADLQRDDVVSAELFDRIDQYPNLEGEDADWLQEEDEAARLRYPNRSPLAMTTNKEREMEHAVVETMADKATINNPEPRDLVEKYGARWSADYACFVFHDGSSGVYSDMKNRAAIRDNAGHPILRFKRHYDTNQFDLAEGQENL